MLCFVLYFNIMLRSTFRYTMYNQCLYIYHNVCGLPSVYSYICFNFYGDSNFYIITNGVLTIII